MSSSHNIKTKITTINVRKWLCISILAPHPSRRTMSLMIVITSFCCLLVSTIADCRGTSVSPTLQPQLGWAGLGWAGTCFLELSNESIDK